MKAVYLEEAAVNNNDISFEQITSVVDTVIYDNTTEDDKYDHIGDAEIVFTNKVIFDEETFDRLPNLKYVGVCATGYNVVDTEAAKRHNVTVTNVPAYSTESVVQLAWGLIMDCTSRIGVHDKSVHNGDWVKSETFCYQLESIIELEGKTLGIVGYGNIGRRMAEIAAAFHMNVLVNTAHPDKYKDQTCCNTVGGYSFRFTGIDELFEKSDIVSLHCPMTKETDGIICKENIAKMKDEVIIINVSRGGLVNEKDLAEALISGKVSRAAADVVSIEPMKADNPLLTAPNMTITPHIAWASLEARKRLIDVVAGNVKAYLSGKPVNVVN